MPFRYRLQKVLDFRIKKKEEQLQEVIKAKNEVDRIQGLIDDNKPLGVYLFVGPTGVGKTESAKIIANSFFGDSSKMIKIDMAEFMEPHSVSKLIGSPPGYVGYDTQTFLIDEVRKKPHSVILLDEIEKAHKEVLDIFLNVFDESRMRNLISPVATLSIVWNTVSFSSSSCAWCWAK